jgi:hypothetical protein
VALHGLTEALGGLVEELKRRPLVSPPAEGGRPQKRLRTTNAGDSGDEGTVTAGLAPCGPPTDLDEAFD